MSELWQNRTVARIRAGIDIEPEPELPERDAGPAKYCELCGQPSLGVWCRKCEDFAEQLVNRYDPLAGFPDEERD